jgi:putative molybdopterin biosynthesis protein
MERNVYLNVTDIEEAVEIYLKKIEPLLNSVNKEMVDVRESRGRITSRPIFARISSPNHNAAAMDGVMVVAERTYSANEANPVVLTRGTDFEYINTGHVIKDPYDSIIMIEDVTLLEESRIGIHENHSGKEILGEEAEKIKIITQASPWQHIRPIGEDIVSGEMILPENHQIRPMDIGAILSGGVSEIEVYEIISVGIMPTGNEISDEYETLENGKIFDTNSWTFKAIVEEIGCTAERISPVNDDYEKLKAEMLKLVENNHLVVINAGSSAGSKDFTASLISDLGELVLHGIAIKPGKPTVLGIVKGKPVIGVPGYPGSAYLIFEEVVVPVIRALQRVKQQERHKAKAIISRRLMSSLKNREYVRVTLGKVGGKLVATPLNRGAGVTMTLVKADGIVVIPKNSEGFDIGEEVDVELIKNIEDIENTLVSIGSHDLIMDYIGSMIEGVNLSSSHVGSMGGIMAIKRGEAHIAPIHLLDEETGEYNTSYIEKYLDGQAELIKGVKREQGLIIEKGNPKNIISISDLARKDVSFVNRQRGSGTRILTDYLLKKEGIEVNKIKGYDRDMMTHMAVAATVKSSTADVGVGVFSVAKAMNLDFISIGFEEYDFAVAKEYANSEMVRAFKAVLQSNIFEEILKELGGYGK